MKYVRRTIWYVATRLLVISLILGMIVLGFYYAMSFTNIHVVLKDGMAQRTKAIMQIEMKENTLDKFFSTSWLERDGTLNAALQGNSEYSDYNVRGIDHRLEMNFFWVWPWDTTVSVNITETVPRIDGRVKGTKAESVIATRGESAVYPPAWPGMKYRVTMSKEGGQWKIKNITLTQTTSNE